MTLTSSKIKTCFVLVKCAAEEASTWAHLVVALAGPWHCPVLVVVAQRFGCWYQGSGPLQIVSFSACPAALGFAPRPSGHSVWHLKMPSLARGERVAQLLAQPLVVQPLAQPLPPQAVLRGALGHWRGSLKVLLNGGCH